MSTDKAKGKDTGLSIKERYAIPRQPMPEQAASERVRNFREVPYGLSHEAAMMEAQRCIQCKKPVCVEGCPVEIDIPGFIDAIAQGELDRGVKILKKDNVLPAICGRVCPQEDQCEKVCVVGKKSDPVAIGRLERYLADYERERGEMELPVLAPSSGKKVAIVGSGPAGLTVAYDCAKMGHEVTVFEALHKPGGVLVYGIPEFRLPKAIVAAEVATLEKLGVKMRTDFVVGLTRKMDSLLDDYDAVFVGTGAGLPYFMGIPGENLNGVYSANEYLTRTNLMQAFDFPNTDTPIAKSKRVAVVGGGNVAMDAARTAKRLGADEVHLIYRRSRKEMPARIEEIERAEEEGVIFHLLCNPLRYLEDQNGRVSQVECLKMELGEPDSSGRRRPVPIPNSEFLMPIDTAIVSIGNGPNPLVPKTTPGLEINTRKGTIIADPDTCKTSRRGIFAGGDIVIGAATVILAMGAGRQASRAIDQYLKDGQW